MNDTANPTPTDLATLAGIDAVIQVVNDTNMDLYDEMYDAVRDMLTTDARDEMIKLGRLGEMMADMIDTMTEPGRVALAKSFDLPDNPDVEE